MLRTSRSLYKKSRRYGSAARRAIGGDLRTRQNGAALIRQYFAGTRLTGNADSGLADAPLNTVAWRMLLSAPLASALNRTKTPAISSYFSSAPSIGLP
jgi:hypothetical protein